MRTEDSSSSHQGGEQEEKEFNTAELDAAMRYDGVFKCSQVFTEKFELHPKVRTPINAGVSKGMEALCMALDMMSVINRRNMFVYQDSSCTSTDNIFYLQLKEVIVSSNTPAKRLQPSGTFSVSSSTATLANLNNTIISNSSASKLNTDMIQQNEDSISRSSSTVSLKQTREEADPRTLFNRNEGVSAQQTSVDFIELSVYGIAEPGPSIKEELVSMLQKKLDESVLDHICYMLLNHTYKLQPEDVHFIQHPEEPPHLSLR